VYNPQYPYFRILIFRFKIVKIAIVRPRAPNKPTVSKIIVDSEFGSPGFSVTNLIEDV
jgi:hypothetical protein